MLNYNSPINENKNHSDLILSEIEPTIKINLRSKEREILSKIGKSLSIIPPTEANTSSSNDILNILWLSPDEWMIYSNNTNDYNYKLEDNLYNEVGRITLNSGLNTSAKNYIRNIIIENYPDQILLGDVNGDEIINVLDVIQVVNLILSLEFNQLADINSDSNIDVLDIVSIVNIILNP